MFNMLLQKRKKSEIAELKNGFFSTHLEGIDDLIKRLSLNYPDFNTDSLAVRLTELAEKHAEEAAKESVKFMEEVYVMVDSEIASSKQTKVCA